MANNGMHSQSRFNGNKNKWNQEQKINLSETPEKVEVLSFYKDDGTTVKEELFDTIANDIAQSFIGKDERGNPCGITSSQIRRIYDEIKRFEKNLLTHDVKEWEKQKPYIKMIKSKTAYAIARIGDKKGVWRNFEFFITTCIDKIDNEKDYHVFLSLFEAVYGFYYKLALDNRLKNL